MENDMTRPQGDGLRMMPGESETPAAVLRRCALEHAGKALDTIVEIMNSEKASTGDRLRAAITVIERAYGKQDGAGSEGSKADMLEDIREELARLRRGEAAIAPGETAFAQNGGDVQTGPYDAAGITRSEAQTGPCDAAGITRSETQTGSCGAAGITRSETRTGSCGAAGITRSEAQAGGAGGTAQSGEEAQKP